MLSRVPFFIAFLAPALASQPISGCAEPNVADERADAQLQPKEHTKPAVPKDGSGDGIVMVNSAKARFHWQMNCQGCHNSDGSGNAERDIPPLVDLKSFHSLKEGREFLIRVPGVARSPLDDVDLANLSNWMMQEFGDTQKNEKWSPYSSKEIAALRRKPLLEDLRNVRLGLVKRLQNQNPRNSNN